MGDESASPPLERRVPGAAGVGPAPLARRVLPDALMERMQAAVDAAHQAQSVDQAAAEAEPVTEPLPSLRAAFGSQDCATVEPPNEPELRGDAWSFRLGGGPLNGSYRSYQPTEGDALDDLAESYLHADPDLTAGFADDAELDATSSPSWPGRSGWGAFGSGGRTAAIETGPVEPGGGAQPERAAWWDHAVQSGRSRAPRPSKARQRATSPSTPPVSRTPPAPSTPSVPSARRSMPRRPQPAMAGMVALAVVLIAGGVVALALASRDSGHRVINSRESQAAKNRAAAALRLDAYIASAATWVAAQVNRSAVVACDPATCEALVEQGFQPGRLASLGPKATTPGKSTLVVDTPLLRHQLGPGLASNWAPAVLAGFGQGAERITVRVLSHHGARAYRVALRADRQERRLVGADLLTSGQVTVTPAARSAMVAGDVDTRLLLVITALAYQHPIHILAFGRTWSGTTIGIPLRTAYFAANDPAAYLSPATYAQAIISLLRNQPTAYRPVHVTVVRLVGQRALRVQFPAPSPLGLINPGQ